MKKEIFALFLLLAVLLGSVWNLRFLKGFTGELDQEVRRTYEAAEAENWALSEQIASAVMDRWTNSDKYTHVFIRHGEIDAVTEGFCSLLGAIRSRDTSGAYAAQLALRLRLTGLFEMERLTPGSIL